MPVDLTQIVKTYDIRGLVGSQLTEDVVEALAGAFVDEIGAAGQSVVVGAIGTLMVLTLMGLTIIMRWLSIAKS
jgi:hypothetical protein